MTNVTAIPITFADHPKAREAKDRSARRRHERELIKNVVATNDLHFHVSGRYTFCYRVDKRNIIEISSAICHPSDKHDPHMGKMVALSRFAAANRMHMRVPPGMPSVRRFLDITFNITGS